jgi:hypothetical protein
MNWLDTETKAILQTHCDLKLAPPTTMNFALVLISDASDHQRLVRAIKRINECSEAKAAALAVQRPPITINWELTEADALHGQFELICCDAISIFLRSHVVGSGDRAYLHSLFQKVAHSVEFRSTQVTIDQIPETESGEKFIDQFLGPQSICPGVPMTLDVSFKKARVMKHWAKRIGGRIRFK